MHLKSILTAPKDGRFILLFGDSGYISTPWRCEVCRWVGGWRNYANDHFTDSGGEPVGWMPLPESNACSASDIGGLEDEESSKPPISEAEAIYEAYPLKVGKPKALAAIKAALKTIEASRLLELTRAFARARPPGTPFTPHPATWFNQQRYNDDPSTWQPGGAPSGPARVAHDLKAKDFTL